MIDHDAQLKLQAFLDGELPEGEGREVANWLARDSEAAGLAAELRNTRQAIKGSERILTLPESREFFWSKIEREIRLEKQPEPTRQAPSVFALLRRFLVPAGAVAGLGLVALLAVIQLNGSAMTSLESDSTDPGAFTYRDYSTRTTLVWLSYPAENEVAQDIGAGTVP
jgi:anti-sigma factor RsiW